MQSDQEVIGSMLQLLGDCTGHIWINVTNPTMQQNKHLSETFRQRLSRELLLVTAALSPGDMKSKEHLSNLNAAYHCAIISFIYKLQTNTSLHPVNHG